MAESLGGLSDKELDRVKGIFVSVDPKRDDTPEELAEYATHFTDTF